MVKVPLLRTVGNRLLFLEPPVAQAPPPRVNPAGQVTDLQVPPRPLVHRISRQGRSHLRWGPKEGRRRADRLHPHDSKPMRAMPRGVYALGWSWSRRWLRSRLLCLYRPVSAMRLGWLSSARVAGSEAENVIKIRKGGQVRCNPVGLTDMITHDDLRSTIARHIEEARRMVTEQKGRIARLKATGVDTALAELTLRALEANLKRFQNHSDWSERKK